MSWLPWQWLVGFLMGVGCCSLQADAQQTVYRVAIVDRFFPPAQGFETDADRVQHGWLYGMMDLDNDEKKEPFYHGDVVRLIASHPQITFIHYPIQDGHAPMEEILSNINNILARYDRQPIDAVILSWESSTLISAFILALESLVSKGIQVFTISGNGGRGMVNTFSFAEGVTTVGAKEKELGHFIANNPFVDTYARAAYEVSRVDDNEGNPTGYDLNGDGCVDIPLDRLTGYLEPSHDYPKKFWRLLTGSSFAAPAALKAALFANLPLTSCH
jgi:hypothetical protein